MWCRCLSGNRTTLGVSSLPRKVHVSEQFLLVMTFLPADLSNIPFGLVAALTLSLVLSRIFLTIYALSSSHYASGFLSNIHLITYHEDTNLAPFRSSQHVSRRRCLYLFRTCAPFPRTTDRQRNRKTTTKRSDTEPDICENCFSYAKAGQSFTPCAGCGLVKYCSSNCRGDGWPSHETSCRGPSANPDSDDKTSTGSFLYP